MDGPLSEAQGQLLVELAIQAVYAKLTGVAHPPAAPDDPQLVEPGACFVTLESRGVLRGCVGSLMPRSPLYVDVCRNAESAMADPRLPPVNADDWPTLDVEVSVLSPLEAVPATGSADLIAALRPGVDGLVIAADGRRATFLPAVWAKVPDPARFLAALLAKGRWPQDEWPQDARVWRYTSQEFTAPAAQGQLG